MGGHARSPWGGFSAKFLRAGSEDQSKRVNGLKSTIKLHFWRHPADRTGEGRVVSEERRRVYARRAGTLTRARLGRTITCCQDVFIEKYPCHPPMRSASSSSTSLSRSTAIRLCRPAAS